MLPYKLFSMAADRYTIAFVNKATAALCTAGVHPFNRPLTASFRLHTVQPQWVGIKPIVAHLAIHVHVMHVPVEHVHAEPVPAADDFVLELNDHSN